MGPQADFGFLLCVRRAILNRRVTWLDITTKKNIQAHRSVFLIFFPYLTISFLRIIRRILGIAILLSKLLEIDNYEIDN